jgi:hypothetical protein
MATRLPIDFHAALRAIEAQSGWRMPGRRPIVRKVPEGTLHADLFWGHLAARLLLSPSGELAIVSGYDPNDFLAHQRPPAVVAGQSCDLDRLDVWLLSSGHQDAYREAASLPDQAARDAWAAAFVAGPLNATIDDPDQRFLPPGQEPETPSLTCAHGTPEQLEALLADVLLGLGGEGDLRLRISFDPEDEIPIHLTGTPRPSPGTVAAVRRAVTHLLDRFQPDGVQLRYNDGPLLLRGGYCESPPVIEIEIRASDARSAHARQEARARLAAAGVPL